jgi:hypothetical protein
MGFNRSSLEKHKSSTAALRYALAANDLIRAIFGARTIPLK